MYPLMDSIP